MKLQRPDPAYREEATPMHRPDANYERMRLFIILLRIGACIALAVSLLLMYDALNPATVVEKATVLRKQISHNRGTSYGVFTQKPSDRERYKTIAPEMYALLEPGDMLVLHQTPITKSWKRVELYRGEQHLQDFQDVEFLPIALLSLLFASPLLSFFLRWDGKEHRFIAKQRLRIFVTFAVVEIVACIVGVALLSGVP